MLTELAANRANMNAAANPACLWLFPGGAAAQTRAAAFRQLVLQAPALVVARSLGYSRGTAICQRHRRRGTWHRYPAIRRGS